MFLHCIHFLASESSFSSTNTPMPSCVHFNIKTTFQCMLIPIVKIRRSWNRRIFIMGTPLLIRQHHFTVIPPWYPWDARGQVISRYVTEVIYSCNHGSHGKGLTYHWHYDEFSTTLKPSKIFQSWSIKTNIIERLQLSRLLLLVSCVKS